MDDDPHLGVDSPRILISDRQDAPVDATALAEVARGCPPEGGVGGGRPRRSGLGPGGSGARPQVHVRVILAWDIYYSVLCHVLRLFMPCLIHVTRNT